MNNLENYRIEFGDTLATMKIPSDVLQNIAEQQANLKAFTKSFFSSPAMQEIAKQQKQMAEVAKSYFSSPAMQEIVEQQKKMAEVAKSFFSSPAMQEIAKQQKQMAELTKNLFSSKIFQDIADQQASLNKVLSKISTSEFIKNIDFDTLDFDSDKFKEYVEIQEEQISDDEKSAIKKFVELATVAFPELNEVSNYFSNKDFTKASIAVLRFIIIYLSIMYTFYTTVLGEGNTYYKINRDNVRVRFSPTTDSKTNILTKLNRNILVEEIQSNNGWVQVRFEIEEGIEKEGWIYRTMLSKIE